MLMAMNRSIGRDAEPPGPDRADRTQSIGRVHEESGSEGAYKDEDGPVLLSHVGAIRHPFDAEWRATHDMVVEYPGAACAVEVLHGNKPNQLYLTHGHVAQAGGATDGMFHRHLVRRVVRCIPMGCNYSSCMYALCM